MKNIAEILKDCPKGTKLYSPLCGECTFEEIDKDFIFFRMYTGDLYAVNSDGSFCKGGECLLFPSKDNRDWDKFCPFKDGDILATDLGSVFYLNKRLNTDEYYGCYVGKGGDGSFHICEPFAYKECCGLATEEEKQQLFDTIKAKGYKWNAETKTLDKLFVPKFKVGDRIKNKYVHKDDCAAEYTIREVRTECYKTDCGILPFENQDNYKLVIEPKFKIGDRIRHKKLHVKYRVISVTNDTYIIETFNDNHIYHMSIKCVNDCYELIPNKFDISTLKPFDKVLVRDYNDHHWRCALYERYDNTRDIMYFATIIGLYQQCIPYKGNEHLLGTINNCDEYYKTW